MSYKLAGQALVDDFLRVVTESVLNPLKECEKKISWQPELKASKKFDELAQKLANVTIEVRLLKENLPAREKLVEVLSGIKGNRMMQFMDDSTEKTEADLLEETIKPYSKIIPQLEEVRRIQYSLLAQARLMKLPAAFNEITAQLKLMEPVIASLTDKLNKAVASVKDGIAI
jgi:hypothetical protein